MKRGFATLFLVVLQVSISGKVLGSTSEVVQPDSTGEWVITIHAGHLDRTQTPVRVSFPFPIEDGVYELRRPAQQRRAMQPGERMQRRQEMREQRMLMQQVGPNHPIPGVIQVQDQRGLLVLPLLPAGRSMELVMSLAPVEGVQWSREGDQQGVEANQQPDERDQQTGAGASGDSGQVGHGIRHETSDTRLSFLKGDRPLFSYLHETEPVPPGVDERHERGGYIYPLHTPSGRNVVQHFNDGRPHQYALWSTWYRTEVDGELVTFWSSLDEDGRVRPEGVRQVSEGPVGASFVAKNSYFDLVPVGESTRSLEVWTGGGQEGESSYFSMEPILNETWQVTMVPDLGRVLPTPSGDQNTRGGQNFQGRGRMMGGPAGNTDAAADEPGRYHLLDIVLTQEVAGEKEVKILEGGYGGISLRGPDEWNRDGAMTFLSSEGHQRSTVQNQPIRWGQLSGELEGEMAGIAILAAPPSVDSPLHPGAPMGGFINLSAEPFFSLGPATLGEFLITPGTPWRAHYRVVVHDGELPARVLDRIWNDLASPPVVEVSRQLSE